MGFFSSGRKHQTSPAPRASRTGPVTYPLSRAWTSEQWKAWEASTGCGYCRKKGCNRTKHSYSICGACGSAWCNGDNCSARRRR